MSNATTLTDEQRNILDTLAEMIIPADSVDDGLKAAGFSGIMETRNQYQPWMARIYEVGLKGIQDTSLALFMKSFLDLTSEQRGKVLNTIKSGQSYGDAWTSDVGPLDFWGNLHTDACFVYCTDQEVYGRIGFPGPSFDRGGYPDYADKQT